MNITFLIGNGFDVGIGMKSRFKDFFPIYQEQSKNKPERIRKLADEIGTDYETWADFESALGRYTVKFNKDTKQDFIAQLRDFEESFISYLVSEESSLKIEEDKNVETVIKNALLRYYAEPNLAPVSSIAIKSLYEAYSSKNHLYNFVNFNYTYTLEKCLQKVSQKIVHRRTYGGSDRSDSIGKIIHVHGRYDLFPIIGVNDINQIANKELAADKEFTNYIVKPSLNELLRQNNDTNATNLINQSMIICVYGMALGETDKKWWQLLIKWLSGEPSRQLVIFDYDEKYTTSTQFAWLEKEDSIIAKLGDYNSNSGINIEDLRTRIHIAVHKNIFAMDIPRKNKDEWKKVLSEINEAGI